MDHFTLQKASKYSGNLFKKAPGQITGFKKRYFEIIEGRLIYFLDYKKLEAKGLINLNIPGIKIEKRDSLNFDIVINNDYIDNMSFCMMAENENSAKEWNEALEMVVEHLSRKRDKHHDCTLDFKEGHDKPTDKKLKFWKIKNIDRDSYDILNKCCSTANDDVSNQLSEKCLSLKGLSEHFPKIAKDKLDNRIMYSFLYKLGKLQKFVFQQRWCFLISSRVLYADKSYKDDICIPPFLPKEFKFDTFYYYEVENENDRSKPLGELDFQNCFGLEFSDKDGKYFIDIDLGDRKYQFYSETRGQRDTWFECMKIAWKTAKDIKASISGRPRNINKLQGLLENEGIGTVKRICNEEIEECMINYRNITDFDTLSKVYENLNESISSTLDGCLLVDPIALEVLKIYVDLFNAKFLKLLQDYWGDYCKNINNESFTTIVFLLLEYQEKMNRFGVNDLNVSLVIDDALTLLSKKNFIDSLQYVDSILKSERAKRAVLDSNTNLIVTTGPVEFFKLAYSNLEVIKFCTHKKVFENHVTVLKELITQYFLGIDTILGREDLDIEKEFFIAISNNTINFDTYLTFYKEDIGKMMYFSPEEISEVFSEEENKKILLLINKNALSRLTSDLLFAMYQEYSDEFKKLETSVVINAIIEALKEISTYLNPKNCEPLMIEALNEYLLYYSKNLMENAKDHFKEVYDLTRKIKRDKTFIIDLFKPYITNEKLNEILTLFDHFIEFFDVSSDMISFSCSKLRELIGPSFDLSKAKTLINLRFDFKDEEKKDALASCKDILDNFVCENGDSSTELLKLVGRQCITKIQKWDGIEKKKTTLEKRNTIIDDDDNDLKKRKTIAMKELMNLGIDLEDINLDDEDEEETEEQTIIKQQKKDILISESDIIKKGVMLKKTYIKWQARFFTLKNGFLYWYKFENSKEAQNFIDLRGIRRIESHKERKFLIIAGEKVYKFACENDDDMNSWINSITNEIKRIKIGEHKKFENIYDVKYKKKKIITDLWNLPKITDHKATINVNEQMKTENYFKEKTNSKMDKSKLKIDKNVLKKVENISLSRSKIEVDYHKKMSHLEVETIIRKSTKSNFCSCWNQIWKCFKSKKYDELNEPLQKR